MKFNMILAYYHTDKVDFCAKMPLPPYNANK